MRFSNERFLNRKICLAAFLNVAIIIFLLFLCLLIQSCMSVLRSSDVEIPINTNVPDAIASYGDQKVITPGVLTLPRNQSCSINISKEGYTPKTIYLQTSLNGWAFTGSILLNATHGLLTLGITTVIGVSIDVGKGSCSDLEPEEIVVTLEK